MDARVVAVACHEEPQANAPLDGRVILRCRTPATDGITLGASGSGGVAGATNRSQGKPQSSIWARDR